MDTLLVLLTTPIVHIGGSPLTLARVLLAIMILFGGIYLARIAVNFIGSRVNDSRVTADAAHLIKRLVFFGLLAIVALTVLGTLGIPLTAFTFVSGAVAIGVGFGAQNIINNFISGWILMSERPIRIGDFVEVEGATGRVEQIHNRFTQIRRVDGVHLLIPNSRLLENTVINWTLVDRNIRTTVVVGVQYGSPVRLVEELMLKAAAEHPGVLKDPAASVFFNDFGDNALVFELYMWFEASSEGDLRRYRSDLRFAMEALFREHGVVVAYPQRDMHVDGRLTIQAEGVQQ